MSISASSRTKSLSGTTDTTSTDVPLVADRWSNNINYSQLVASTCVGIVQLWWQPYLHDLKKLLPFLFLYNIFSILVGYPLLYLELALGVITKKSILGCWDMAPIGRGIAFAALSTSLFSALALSTVGAWSLALLVHSLHVFLPWLHCAARAAPPCAARHRPLPDGSETPTHSFFFNYVLDIKRDGFIGGFGYVVRELSIYLIICWVLIYFIAFKRIYGYSKLILFKDVLAVFMLLCCGVGVIRLNGAGKMFRVCDWSALFEGIQIWRDAIEFSLIQLSISQGTLVMLGSMCPQQQHKLGRTVLVTFLTSKVTSMATALTLGAALGALQEDYEGDTRIGKGASASMIVWADFVTRIPGSQFWSALFFFTLLVLSLTSTALLVQTVMSTFTGRFIRKIRWAFLVLTCCLLCFIGTITLSTQAGLNIMNFLMTWPVTKPRVPVAAATAMVVTYLYGQSTFCENVYFAVGEYPCVFFRVCWAISPVILLLAFLSHQSCPATESSTAGLILDAAIITPIFLTFIFYLIFKCRVRNIVGNEK